MGKARLYMRQYCQGVRDKKICFEMKRMKTLESDPKTHSKKLGHPPHDDKEHLQPAALQRQDQQQESNTEQRQKYMSGTYKFRLVRYTAVYSSCQVQVPCCETTQDT